VQKRKLGKTNLDISLMGLGGFHLIELSDKNALEIINRYLDQGGNYLETAASYGFGNSELKIGKVAKNRRSEFILASKSTERGKKELLLSIDESLKRSQTDLIDIFFLHEFGRYEFVEAASGPNGALEGLEEAKRKGKIRFAAFSSHISPEVALRALETYPFDVIMVPLNYFDRFNFPLWESQVIPTALAKQVGLLAMKVFADGFLWRSWENALRYTLSLPISSVIIGANTIEYLEKDIQFINNIKPMNEDDKELLFLNAPELGQYVCRQCDKCLPCPKGIDIPRVFVLEGQWDRQIADGVVRDPSELALRDRLRFWFGNQDYAQEAYEKVNPNALACNECGECIPRCPYNLPIIEKLKIAHEKLTDTRPPTEIRIM